MNTAPELRFKQNKINLVVTNSANAGFYGRLAAFFASVPSCYYSHGWSSVYNGKKITFLLNFIERILAFISQKVICVSENDYNTALDKIKIPHLLPLEFIVLNNQLYPNISRSNLKILFSNQFYFLFHYNQNYFCKK